jgi:hypothetical protein
MEFPARIEIENINPYVEVSPARARRIKAGMRKPIPVRVRINGKPEKPWRINMMPKGGGMFFLYLHDRVRKASGAAVGDKVRVEVEFDADYRGGPVHPMPAWFRKALAGNAAAGQAYAALPPSRRKEILRYFANLKSDEAKVRNLAKAMHVLSGKSGRFMARSWKDGK